MNGCAPGLALIKRLKATRKWAIGHLFIGYKKIYRNNNKKKDTVSSLRDT